MSTRSTIAVVKENGSVISSYCHYDGYIEEGVGEELFTKFNSYKDAIKLVEGGNIRSIVGISGVEYFKGEECEKWNNIVDFYKNYEFYDYTYIFQSGEWFVINHSSHSNLEKLKTYF